MNSFAKLNDGSWGIRVQGPVKVGDRVSVEKRDGTTSLQTVTRVIWTGNGVSLCEIASAAKPPRDYSPYGADYEDMSDLNDDRYDRED